MRIIGGKHRGRALLRVGKQTTRETADMVKEAVFNMLGGQINGVVLDLFAGSGAYGLEALSRGASHVYAIDTDRDAVQTLLLNTKTLGELDQMTAVIKDYQRFLNTLDVDIRFDIVFIDPPYDFVIYHEVIDQLDQHLNDRAMIVCESKKQVVLDEERKTMVKIKEKVYGIKRITIYQKQ